jgi:hypothetical protein
VRGSRREAGSIEIRPAAKVDELVDSPEVRFLEIGMVVEHLLFGHTGVKPAEDGASRG